MSSTIDTELRNIETKLNDDNIRVDALEKGVTELNGRNTNVNNESVTHYKNFKYLNEKFSNTSHGGGKKTRKNKRRRTKKNSKCHKKRRSLKKRH